MRNSLLELITIGAYDGRLGADEGRNLLLDVRRPMSRCLNVQTILARRVRTWVRNWPGPMNNARHKSLIMLRPRVHAINKRGQCKGMGRDTGPERHRKLPKQRLCVRRLFAES
jgi:hypothetical protein